MIYKGIARGKRIELEGDTSLPDGTSVRIIPEQPLTANGPQLSLSLKEWLQEARQVRAQLPKTSDSVELLRQLREGRAQR